MCTDYGIRSSLSGNNLVLFQHVKVGTYFAVENPAAMRGATHDYEGGDNGKGDDEG
jgi:hypothetical protein